MNKKDFMKKLKNRLLFLSLREKKEVLSYYSEMIEDAMEDGLTEAEAIGKLGTMAQIIQKIKEESREKEIEKKMSAERILLMVLLSPFIFSILALCTSLVLFLYCVLLTIYLLGFTFIIIAFAYTIDFFFTLFSNVPFAILELGLAVLSAGLSMVLLMGMNRIFKKANHFAKGGFTYVGKWIRGY